MGLISTEVEVTIGGGNAKYYEELGYEIPRRKSTDGKMRVPRGTKIRVKIEDLQLSSNILVETRCDGCGKFRKLKYQDYVNYLKEDGKSYCKKCAMNLYGTKNRIKSALKNSKSIAQWLIEKYGGNALEKYWDKEKNDEDGNNPWNITYSSKIKCWFICQEKNYHGSYQMYCNDFVNDHRCPYCSNNKVHPKDSLKQYIVDNFGEDYFNKVWSDKNTVNPETLKPNSKIVCLWNCPDNKHEAFKRSCNYSLIRDFKCPTCSYEKRKGENNPNYNPELTDEERERGRKIDGYYYFVTGVFKRDNYTCQCCNSDKGKLNAHHLNGYNWDKEHRVDVNNGITLCEDCHKEFHHIYGYGNNTKEQYEEWIKTKIIKEV